MKLLFINALKGLKKKKIQMAGIIIMVFLSTAIYVAMNTSIDRLEDRYYSYLDEQNVEDITLGVNINYSKDVTATDLEYIKSTYLANMSVEETEIILAYEQVLNGNVTLDSNLELGISTIFKKYNIDKYIENNILKTLASEYNFTYELEKSKTSSIDNLLMKAIPYYEDNKINKTYLVEGSYPVNDNEITILKGFAKANDIEIGDNYKIGETTYKVVGFAYAPDYVYPLISFSVPFFDEKNNNIVFMNEKTYDSFIGIEDDSYAFRFNGTSRKFEFSFGPSEENNDSSPITKLLEEQSNTISVSMNTVVRITRIGELQLEFSQNRTFAKYFLYLLLGVSVFIIIVVTKKRIDDERLQIGVLKSLGYNRFSIAFSYLVYPIVGSIIGGTLGYAFGTLIHYPLADIYRSYYAVPLENFKLDINYLKVSVLVPLLLLSILSYLIALFMLRKKPLDLLKEGSNLKVNIFSRLINKITRLLPFNYRFKYSLAARSLGKLFIVTLTSFCTGLLIVLTLIGMNLFNDLIDKSFDGVNYDYLVSMNGVKIGEGNSSNDDYVLAYNSDLVRLVDKAGNEKKLEDNYTISLSGIDVDSKYIEVLDEDNTNINSILNEDNSIIINQNIKKIIGAEIGDTLVFKANGIEYDYIVAGVADEYMSYVGYVNRQSLSTNVGLPSIAYTQIYSKDIKYNNMQKLTADERQNINMILSFKDLKNSIQKQMDRFNTSIYIVIGFASVMAFIIIAVIANIVVEENKKTISLMKVMGYDNKRISKIVLNIYTPFVIIAYLLSIPAMVNLLKWIVSLLTKDVGMVIPITLSPTLAIVGLISLLVAYYIAIYLSKRVLNKVPLAVALKRE